MASQDKADTKERKENSRAPVTPLTAKSWFTWYRVAASAVVLLAGFASPQFSSSFYGKAVVGIAKCVAFSQTKAMGQCLSNVFSGRAAAPDTPVTGTAPGETAVHPPAGLPGAVFDESAVPQKQYDADGRRVFPEAQKHRAEADYQAKLRADKVNQSQKAYQAGDKANAHELSVEGKRHGNMMEEANKQAVRAILQPQNSEGTGVLDLHGLYVKEAEEATKAFLLEQQRAKRFGAVEVITGAGHHSDGQEAKIRPAVGRLISELDFPYNTPSNNDGAFVVKMFNNQDLVDQLQE